MTAALLAAAFTFTATATGVEKGTPVEFLFAGKGTDRDYETLFVLDDSVDNFCKGLEKAGVPRGKPVDQAACRLWPVGCRLTFSPALETFLDGKMPEGYATGVPIYTGGTRLADGSCEASTNMPLSAYSIYTLAQSPIVFDGIYEQGVVYNSFTAKRTLEKGKRFSFSVTWDEKTMPKSLNLVARPGKAVELLSALRKAADDGEIDVTVGFDDNLSLKEATAVANSLATLDSVKIKLNGVDNIFYRSFLPLVKWLDRKERLTQPFELTIGDSDKLLFIEEDWSVEGDDPKLTPKEISFADAVKYPRTDTCFIYTSSDTKISRICESMKKFPKDARIRNWYVFAR